MHRGKGRQSVVRRCTVHRRTKPGPSARRGWFCSSENTAQCINQCRLTFNETQQFQKPLDVGVISHEKRRCFSAVASHLVRKRFYCTGDTISPFFLPNASATSSHHARWADFSFRFTTNVFLIFREPECILTGSRKDSEPFTLN